LNIDIEICRGCSDAVKMIAFIEDPLVIKSTLTGTSGMAQDGCQRRTIQQAVIANGLVKA
jgi:hypothetical protein